MFRHWNWELADPGSDSELSLLLGRRELLGEWMLNLVLLRGKILWDHLAAGETLSG